MNTRLAIVGSGFGLYGLLPAFNRVNGCQVISICGKNSERMQRYCKKLGLKNYTNWKEMLQKEKPNAVAIAVIPRYQYEIAKYALENRIAVFAEKPLTTSVHASSELNRLAKKKRLPNMIDFIFPEIPEWHTAKKVIKSGVIGNILNIEVDWTFLSYDLKNHIKSWKTDVSQGGGALSFYFSHVFYYLEYFIGRIRNIQCIFSSSKKNPNKGETIINMIILFENGCTGNAHMNIRCTGKQRHIIKFHGEKGVVTLQNNSNNFFDDFELTANTQKGIQKIKQCKIVDLSHNETEDPRVKVIKPIAERFINWCSTGTLAKPDFSDGLRVQELIKMARVSDSKFHKCK